jgi:hypothetical protein
VVKRYIKCTTSLFSHLRPPGGKDEAGTLTGSPVGSRSAKIVEVKIDWSSANRLTLRSGKSILMIKRFI